MNLQREIIDYGEDVSLDTFLKIINYTKIDKEMFLEDYHSDWIIKRFKADQNMAQEMNITSTPSCIVYTSNNDNVGYLIENFINKEMLHNICHKQSKILDGSIIPLHHHPSTEKK